MEDLVKQDTKGCSLGYHRFGNVTFESNAGRFEMRNVDGWRHAKIAEPILTVPKDFERIASQLCEKALMDAKSQLHPLLQNMGLDRLDKRGEFIGSFKAALERRIARKLAVWQPGVQAVFTYDETRIENLQDWDGSIHLLVKVPRLSGMLKALAAKLDKSLVTCLNRMGWQRSRTCQSILDVQQVTPNELRHGISYGAMFFAVHTAPVKVWPQTK